MDDKTTALNIEKLQAEITKLISDTAKVNKELKWYEVTIIIAGTLAIVAITKLAL